MEDHEYLKDRVCHYYFQAVFMQFSPERDIFRNGGCSTLEKVED